MRLLSILFSLIMCTSLSAGDIADATVALSSSEPTLRAIAASELYTAGAESAGAIDTLIEHFTDTAYIEGAPLYILYASAVGNFGLTAAPKLVAPLESDNLQVVIAAATALAEIGPAALPYVEDSLVKMLEGTDDDRKIVVASIIQCT